MYILNFLVHKKNFENFSKKFFFSKKNNKNIFSKKNFFFFFNFSNVTYSNLHFKQKNFFFHFRHISTWRVIQQCVYISQLRIKLTNFRI